MLCIKNIYTYIYRLSIENTKLALIINLVTLLIKRKIYLLHRKDSETYEVNTVDLSEFLLNSGYKLDFKFMEI